MSIGYFIRPTTEQEIGQINTNENKDLYLDWFAFSLIDDEMFMSPVSDDRIKEIKSDSTAVTNIRARENDHEAA